MTYQVYIEYSFGGNRHAHCSLHENSMEAWLLKNVCFLLSGDGKEFALEGTGFFIHRSFHKGVGHVPTYLVTARHVIGGVREKKASLYARINLKEGGFEDIRLDLEAFEVDLFSRVDAAILPLHGMVLADELSRFDIVPVPATETASSKISRIDAGVEIKISGLFSKHWGKDTITPVLRTGHLAMWPAQKLDFGHFGESDGYIVEVLSIGGLSGSPVFVKTPISKPSFRKRGGFIKTHEYRWLGLVHGHWDEKDDSNQTAQSDEKQSSINMGMAMVVPAYKVLEILGSEEIKSADDEFYKQNKDNK